MKSYSTEKCYFGDKEGWDKIKKGDDAYSGFSIQSNNSPLYCDT
jgi:hypothetical protein